MQRKLPTIKEIAKQLNVTTSTVSRALNDKPQVGLLTRLKVQKLAKELNYEPNSKAVFLKNNRSFVIGVIVPTLREDFFSEAVSGIESLTIKHGYTILFGQSYDDPEKEMNAVAAMRKQRVDGLIISLSKNTCAYEHLLSLEKINMPVVYFDRVLPMENAHRVYCNLYKGTAEMVGWLIQKGYKRIGFINGPSGLPCAKERMKGYIDAITKKKIKIDMQLVEETDLTKEKTYAAMKHLLALKLKPAAIITFNDYVHMDAVQFARSKKIKINKEIIFVSYANLPITGYSAFPPLVSVEQYPYSQGVKAMEIMLKIFEKEKFETDEKMKFYSHEITCKLVVHS